MRDFQSEHLTDLATTDVQELWDMFASRLEQGIDKFIPTRKAGTCDGFPWINQEIRRLMRKMDKLYKWMKRSGRPNDTKKFLEYKHLLRRVTDRAYERYLGPNTHWTSNYGTGIVFIGNMLSWLSFHNFV